MAAFETTIGELSAVLGFLKYAKHYRASQKDLALITAMEQTFHTYLPATLNADERDGITVVSVAIAKSVLNERYPDALKMPKLPDSIAVAITGKQVYFYTVSYAINSNDQLRGLLAQ